MCSHPPAGPKPPTTAGHSHSPEPPGGWPTLERLAAYRDAVRAKVHHIYAGCRTAGRPRSLGLALEEVLWMAFEHEAM